MRAILCRELTGIDGLHLTELPDPGQPGPGQLRIRIAAAGLNFADLLVSAGKYQVKHNPPFVPGFELAGLVEAVGPGAGGGVTQFKPGDAVMAISESGAFAEFALVDAQSVYPAPKGLDMAECAGFPIAYGTSYLALVEQARLQAGEVLLVHGAAGGVGLTAVEIGKALGARVIATAGGPDKCAIAARHGADRTIDYKSEDIRSRVKALAAELTNGERDGADVVYDPVGGEVFDASLRCVNWNARILIVGFAGGGVPQIPANILLVKNVAAMGFYFGSWRRHRPDLAARAFAALDRMVEAGQLKPLVSHRLDLAEYRAALELVQGRKSTGKVVLTLA
ncbi:MAG TPA: NADPH:quinone oxidoreductase family protein [Alphaproteobacteria bacterium]|nr:NADPH:quinone oxidoreductase family protein [Alphaproteobacteria bacterium]